MDRLVVLLIIVLSMVTTISGRVKGVVEHRGRPGIAPDDSINPADIPLVDEEEDDDPATIRKKTLPKKNCSKSCRPESCSKFDWFEGGPNVWYLASDRSARWYKVAKDCAQVEPGFTTIATVRSRDELQNLQKVLPANSKYWLGGVRLGLPVWHWYTYKGRRESLKTIKKFFWKQGEPNKVTRIKKCLVLDGQDGWSDRFCWIGFQGLCEFRCLDPNDPNNLR